MSPRFSLVMPAYNEVARLPPYLASIREHFGKMFGDCYEVIVVDDGSRDGLADALRRLAADWPQLSVLTFPCNRGKGAAVRAGVLAARGELILFADADGATPIAEERSLRQALEQGCDLAIGSRLCSAATRVERLRHRSLCGRLFAWSVRQLFGLSLRDTQCGFKMFRREQGQILLRLCREPGYLIDVELLVYAHRLGLRIAEVPVFWRDVPGSQVRLLRDGLKMLRGFWRLRRSFHELDLTCHEINPLSFADVALATVPSASGGSRSRGRPSDLSARPQCSQQR